MYIGFLTEKAMPYKDMEKRRVCKKAYREKNAEALRAKAREKYAQAHPPKPKKPTKTLEEKRAYQRAYREANKEKCKELTKKWAENNKDRVKELTRDWQKKNPERFKELTQRYRANNKEHIRQVAKIARDRRYAENPEKVGEARKALKARQMAKDPERFIEMRRAVIRKSSKKLVAEITDGYVAHLLAKSSGYRLLANEVPKELLEAKRLQLMIKRELEK
jgi:hypothetical protein